ncbi:MAG TPA: hypothetical protein VLH81_10055, partial [Desulfobacterales bacterium]|nr:hypothetical protein [Desulfobacterales bacterium]
MLVIIILTSPLATRLTVGADPDLHLAVGDLEERGAADRRRAKTSGPLVFAIALRTPPLAAPDSYVNAR